LVFLDQTACQNVPNVRRVLYLPGENNIQVKNPVKFKITCTGFQGVNCNSYMEFHDTNNALDFVKIIANFRMINIENNDIKELINNIINNKNLSDEEIKKYLSEKNLSFHDLKNKINDSLYGDFSKQQSIEKVEKTCKKENINNTRKIDYEKRKRMLENFNNPKLINLMKNEKIINIVLDNYRVHHSKIVEKIAEILRIRLIFLPPYCPQLNPIEDVWRQIKDKIYCSAYQTLDELKNIFKAEFNKIIDYKSFYEIWLKDYLNVINF